MTTVSVVSCCYGDFGKFTEEWYAAVGGLHRVPDDVVVCSPDAVWKHPQARGLNFSIACCQTEWAWFVDFDDLVLPSGLDGIDELHLETDVWLTGYVRSDGFSHVPRALPNDEYLASRRNPYPAGSVVRVDAFREVGGFDDIAYQDWGLWRKLAQAGKGFTSSGRVNYIRRLHPGQRTETELGHADRGRLYDEMGRLSLDGRYVFRYSRSGCSPMP